MSLVPSQRVAIMLACVAVHAQEALSPGGHPFDANAIDGLLGDPEVVAYMDVLGSMALLPVKRDGT